MIILPLPFIHYFFSTGYYPNFIIDFFKINSDKFEWQISYRFVNKGTKLFSIISPKNGKDWIDAYWKTIKHKKI